MSPHGPTASMSRLAPVTVGLVAVSWMTGCQPEIAPSDAEPVYAAEDDASDPTGLAEGQTADADLELTPAQITVVTAGDPAAPPDLRREALLRIVNSSAGGDPVYLAFYRAILIETDTDPTVAAVAAMGLGDFGEPSDTGFLTPLLTHEDAFLRWRAAVALQRLHNTQAIAPLLEAATDDEDADVRATAAYALGQYRRRDVVDGLITALDDRDYGVSRAARETLQLLTGHDAGDDPRAWVAFVNDHSATLFDHAAAYTYEPYPERNPFNLLQFFGSPDPEPALPTGYTPPVPAP
ncbi:MAG: HEAT repeat domain-containing protein [Planctomycetota bacterium]